MNRRTVMIALIMLVIGFGAGFLLRPVIVSAPQSTIVAGSPPAFQGRAEPRGTQYFEAHIDEARQVVAACREGSVRGDECVNAETAVITIESQERFRRFRDR